MGKVAFLFSGQGAQHPGMGAELCAREAAAKEVFDEFEGLMPGLQHLCFEGTKEELTRTENTQPAVFSLDLAAARALVARGVKPSCVAGFSLGEIAALTFAGAFGQTDGFRLVRHRGELMAQAGQENPGGMRAVVKLPAQKVEELAAQAGAWPVNYNSAQQTVVAGRPDALAQLDSLVRAAKGRSLKLAVSGAFHSPLMAGATEGLRAWLATTPPKAADPQVWANATASPYPDDPAQMADLLARQASSPVRWQQTIEGMAAQGVDTFVEVGPGQTLTKLVGRIVSDAVALPCETTEQLDAVLAQVQRS